MAPPEHDAGEQTEGSRPMMTAAVLSSQNTLLKHITVTSSWELITEFNITLNMLFISGTFSSLLEIEQILWLISMMKIPVKAMKRKWTLSPFFLS